MKEEKANLQYLCNYRFNTKFYKSFSKSIRAKFNAIDRDTFIRFCSAISMIVYTRDKSGEFDYLELDDRYDVGKLANIVIQPSDDLELGINLTTGEVNWILPKDDRMRQGKINEADIRYVLQFFNQIIDRFFYEDPVRAMADYYHEFVDDHDGDYDEEVLFEQMGFKSWVIAGECYETKAGITEFFYELSSPLVFGMRVVYICPLVDYANSSGEERKYIIYSFDDCATLFGRAKLSTFPDQDQLKRFYLDLYSSFMASLY